MIRTLYTLFYCIIFPIVIIRLFLRSLTTKAYRKRLSERFGLPPMFEYSSARNNRPILFHAVSVGEVNGATGLIKKLLTAYPDTPIVLTTMTVTGSEQVKKTFSKELKRKDLVHCYLPYDIPVFISSFLNRINPRIIMLMETELWPNLLHYSEKKKINSVLINGRLSAKSQRLYKTISPLASQMLSKLTMALVQNQNDKERFVNLGMMSESIHSVGNLKFDFNITDEMKDESRYYRHLWQSGTDRDVLLAASTHEGEEEIILKCFQNILFEYTEKTSPLLVIVPRHPERFKFVKKLAEKYFSVSMLSDDNFEKGTQVLIADVMGKLNVFYGAASVAFVGGSLFSRGGHNILEPAAWCCPVIIGSSVFNFKDIVELYLENNAIVQSATTEAITKAFITLLRDEEKAEQIASNGYRLFKGNHGADKKTLELIEPLLVV
jgi:3-deoxy-D-manno-octulosonic-acid transferase